MTRGLLVAMAGALLLAACMSMEMGRPGLRRIASSGKTAGGAAPSTVDPPILPTDLAAPLHDAAGAHAELCANDGAHPNFPDDADEITKQFCQDLKPGGAMPTPRSLADLKKVLGLSFADPNGGNGVGGNPAFAILGHSSALTARKVSTIAPTTFVFTPPPADGSRPVKYTVLAFDPGEQFVEVASYDPTAAKVNFYVVFFDQACTHSAAGCSPTDLLTPKLVTGWSNLRVYEDTTALGNTIFDCHVCHQPDNAGAPFLRMQEITAPFTHWFSRDTEGGRALLADFHAAHGTEDYGGIPGGLVDASDPSKLAALIRQAGFGDQPNAFDSTAIEAEVKAAASAQPAVNVPAGASATWARLYDGAVQGAFIAPPYHDVKVTDPDKLAAATRAYAAYRNGQATEVPDILDVLLDDGLRDMGFAPKANANGRALLAQMCEECHHAKLDPQISREKFLVDALDSMPRMEKEIAIDRLKLPLSNRLAMPPALFRTITDDERQAMIDELSK